MNRSDAIDLLEARKRFGDLAEQVVRSGQPQPINKNGRRYVALVDAKALERWQALEAEHANLLLLEDAEAALREHLDGARAASHALERALSKSWRSG